MKLEDARSAYENLSRTASDIIRQLSLAAVALVWVFKTGSGSSFALEPQLRQGLLFVFAALFFDLLQYLVGAATWHIYFRVREREHTGSKQEFEAPVWINWPTWTLFWMKAAAMLISYGVFILPFLIKKFI
jgi:hypothetical protein